MVYKEFCEALLDADKFFILDTETTGLHDGEICQIAIIDNQGKVVFNDYVKTRQPIPPHATAIHGITDEMVAEARTWAEILPEIGNILHSQIVVVYNAVYDRKMMHKSSERWDLGKTEWKQISTFLCAMEAYAEYYGQWNNFHKSYRWQTLTHAARHEGFEVRNAHSALGDCQMTLSVVGAMLKAYMEDNETDKSFTAHDDAVSDGCVMCGNEWKSLNKHGRCSRCEQIWNS